MTTTRPLPRHLRTVAAVHILQGTGSVVEVFVRLYEGHYLIALGVLGIPIGFGLLRGSRAWRTLALVFTWGGLIMGPVVMLAGLGPGTATFGVCGFPLGEIPRAWLYVVGLPLFLLLLWSYGVLVRPDVRAWFGVSAPADGRPAPGTARCSANPHGEPAASRGAAK